MDETKRLRECEFAEFEINEIEAANLSLGEDDEVENEFKKLSDSEKVYVFAFGCISDYGI